MSQELLRDALEQSGRFPAAVRSAALCHIARVLTKSDPAEARRVLEEGLALASALPDDEQREILVGVGAVLAAAISPPRAFAILSTLTGERQSVVSQMLVHMVDHGFRDAATEYVLDAGLHPMDAEFQFGMALHVVGPSKDPEIKRRMLRGAIAAMREIDAGRGRKPTFGSHDFVHFFVFHWRLLPEEEARAAVREQVQRILSVPDSPMNAGFSAGAERVTFTSTHQAGLFEILEPLQELDPDLAASTVPRYRELSAAAWRFPYGPRSITEQMEREAEAARASGPEPPPDATCFDYVGSTPIQDALRTGFAQPFAAAMDEYDNDVDPDDYNEVPQECWPSAAAFRTILYKAGQYEGASAARYLDRIPDPALRLFAQIELAAALAGLPQLGSTTMRRGSRARRRMARAAVSDARAPSEIPPGLRPLSPSRKPDLPPSRTLRVSRATAPDAGVSGGSGSDFVEIRNASLASVVSHLFEMPLSRIQWPASIDPSARYDFVLVLAADASDEQRRHLVREGIAAHFDVRISIEELARDVWLWTAPHGINVRARRTPPMSTFGWQAFSSIGISSSQMAGQPRVPDAIRLQEILKSAEVAPDADPRTAFEHMQKGIARSLGTLTRGERSIDGIQGEFAIGELCELLEAGLDRPLIDETGLDGRYVIAFDSDAPDGFLRAVTDRLGLQLSEGRRTLPTLVVASTH